MEKFQTQYPEAYFELAPYIVHHNQLLSAWELKNTNGQIIMSGYNYALTNSEGKIVRTTEFFNEPHSLISQ